MKKSIYKLALILFLIPLVSFANNDTGKKHEKSRTIKKEYSVSSDAIVGISNKYGNINVITWNKNRVEITVKITVKGNDLSVVEKKLRNINVDFNANSSMVSAKTIFGKSSKSWSFWGKSNKTSYQIDYTVKMPKSNSVKLNNDYGSILVNEIDGSADIDCDYGKIIIGDLNHSNNSINLDYCSRSTINYMKSGTVNVDYSKLTIDKIEDVKANSDYSTLNFGDVGSITFNADYGSVTIDSGNDITGNTDYVSVHLGKVKSNLNLKADYGSIKIKELVKGFSKADISGQYAGITIGTSSNNSFNFEIDLSYGSFKRNDNNINLNKSISKSSKKYYEGSYGKSNGSSKLTIKSQYGSVSLKEQ